MQKQNPPEKRFPTQIRPEWFEWSGTGDFDPLPIFKELALTYRTPRSTIKLEETSA